MDTHMVMFPSLPPVLQGHSQRQIKPASSNPAKPFTLFLHSNIFSPYPHFHLPPWTSCPILISPVSHYPPPTSIFMLLPTPTPSPAPLLPPHIKPCSVSIPGLLMFAYLLSEPAALTARVQHWPWISHLMIAPFDKVPYLWFIYTELQICNVFSVDMNI